MIQKTEHLTGVRKTVNPLYEIVHREDFCLLFRYSSIQGSL